MSIYHVTSDQFQHKVGKRGWRLMPSSAEFRLVDEQGRFVTMVRLVVDGQGREWVVPASVRRTHVEMVLRGHQVEWQ